MLADAVDERVRLLGQSPGVEREDARIGNQLEQQVEDHDPLGTEGRREREPFRADDIEREAQHALGVEPLGVDRERDSVEPAEGKDVRRKRAHATASAAVAATASVAGTCRIGRGAGSGTTMSG